nr:hypothetical protein [Tanacetum cinerariifolium]GEY90573.1 hypothetical protein [Tanacetum cinerariifolium]
MIKDVTNKEFKEAMFEISDSKAPRPDGYTACFFKKAWDIVGSDICYAVKEFFANRKFLKEINTTLIALIPKVNNACCVIDYRPIACGNALYKCISKILTSRNKGGLDKLVNLNQSDFIQGRSIQDNILLTRELLKGYNRKNSVKRCSLKIDIAKDYDTNPKFKYHAGCKGIKLTHLCFAGVLLVMCYGNVKSDKVVKEALVMFNIVSGLKPNMRKSTIFFGSMDIGEKNIILEVMPFQEGRFPMRYLGALFDSIRIVRIGSILQFELSSGLTVGIPFPLPSLLRAKTALRADFHDQKRLDQAPLINKRLSKDDCKQIIDKVKNIIADWKNKFLSHAGRVQLIAFVLRSMKLYWASVFLLPKLTVKDIERILKGFLWAQGDMARDKKDTLCVQWIHMVKLKKRSLWDIDIESNDSWIWKDLEALKIKIHDTNLRDDWASIVNSMASMGQNRVIKIILKNILFGAAVYLVWKERNRRLFTPVKREEKKDLLEAILEVIKFILVSLRVINSRGGDVGIWYSLYLERYGDYNLHNDAYSLSSLVIVDVG